MNNATAVDSYKIFVLDFFNFFILFFSSNSFLLCFIKYQSAVDWKALNTHTDTHTHPWSFTTDDLRSIILDSWPLEQRFCS